MRAGKGGCLSLDQWLIPHDGARGAQVAAYWLWAARDLAWLDDESGTPRRPCELRARTPGTVAIYGEHSPDFFLVVVSGVEGVDAKPKVRVIVNPSRQLQPTESGSITLSGVQSVTSLTYGFAHIIGPAPDGGGEELDAQAVHK